MKRVYFLYYYKKLIHLQALGCLFLLFSGFSSPVSAVPLPAKVDSLEQILPIAGEADKLKILEILIPYYLNSDSKTALSKSQQALEIARKQQNYRMLAIALNHKGNSIRYLLSDYDSALTSCQEALAVSMQYSLPFEQIRILLTIGEIYEEVGNSYKSLENFMQAQVLAESLGHHIEIVNALNKIGRVYASIGNNTKAIEYHKKAVIQSEQNTNLKGKADSHYWLATAYQENANLDLALQNHSNALELRQKTDDDKGSGYSYLALGKIYLAKGSYNQAREAMNLGLQTFEKLNFPEGQALSYNYMATLLIEEQLFTDALPYLKSALAIGESRNDKKIIRDSYENLYTCYAALKDYEQALKFKDLFVAISDFIYGEESERRVAELQTRFEIAEKEREIDALKKDNELRELAMQKQANFRDFLMVGLILLLIILILIIYMYRNNRQNTRQLQRTNSTIHQQNLELQELNATKDKFFSIISHDMKGPLNSLTAFSGMLIKHSDAFSREEIQMLATDFDKSLKNLLSLLENLLEWSRAQTGVLEISPEPLPIRDLVQANVELLQKMADNKSISIITEIPGTLWGYAGKNQMNTVLRNLISNALKFTKQGGQVTITASEWKDALEIAVHDTGVGIDPDTLKKLFKIEHKHTTLGTAKETGTGLGLMLCKEFIEQSGGALSVESEEGRGSTFRFTLPKAENLQEQEAVC